MSEDTKNPISENKATHHTIDYVGTTGELLPIVLMNLLLTIITLGIYWAWARTSIRKHLWYKTRFDNEPFEYTGTGGELFFGAIIASILLGLALTTLQALSTSIPMLAPVSSYLIYPLIIFLIGVAIYRAQTYRMSRTKWRRIRGAQLAKSMVYGWLTLKYSVLFVITFGLISPYIICRMWNFVMNNKRMGSGIISCDVESRPLFRVWFISWLVAIFVLGGISVLIYMALASNSDGLLLVGYILMFVASSVIFAWFRAALLSHLVGGLKFQKMAVNFHIEPVELLVFSVVNSLILIFTLGLGIPFVTQRWLRLICDRMSFSGDFDFVQISLPPERGPMFGEGLAEVFDVG